MVYPTLTDNFNLADLNANFLELYKQMNVAKSETPTASDLGTIKTHLAMVKSGIGRYKLNALSGTWTTGTTYTICTLDVPYRPAVLVRKDIVIRSSDSTYIATFIINIGGTVTITPRSAMSGIEFWIDETYII